MRRSPHSKSRQPWKCQPWCRGAGAGLWHHQCAATAEIWHREPRTVWSIHKVSSRANSHKILEQGSFLSASFFPEQNETLQIARQHGEQFKPNQKGTHWKPNRKPYKCVVGETLDIGILTWYLVCGGCFPTHLVSACATFGANSSKLARLQ